ncbi:MAG TPA: YciI family protein [Gemmatimonadaceae bacterium]|nr:YciI family protein [Gemmatimonadaceae bacterium]
MRYMMLIKHSDDVRKEKVPQGLIDAMGEFVGAAMKNGTITDTAGLTPTAQGTRIRLDGGKITVTDGPFTEAKEIVGGYALAEFASRDAALAFARKFMELHRVHWPEFNGECEVRPLESMG